MIYPRKIQFISLPELTGEIKFHKSIACLLKDAQVKIQSHINRIDLSTLRVNVLNPLVHKYEFIFFTIDTLGTKINKLGSTDTFYIYNANIRDFIEEQLSTDNDTIFLPKLIEGV